MGAFSGTAVNAIVHFEVSVHQHRVLSLLGNAGYLAGEQHLRLGKRKDNQGVGSIEIVVPRCC